jgi:hypothetical protein
MQLPFTVEEFFNIFRDYNETLWPFQAVLAGLALIAVLLVFKQDRRSGVVISAILAFFWGWIALAYHLAFFAGINPLAYLFAAVSLAGALAFLWQGVFRQRLQFAWKRGGRSFTGAVLVVFALVIYPLWSRAAGHGYPAMPTFGLPCPTTIFTIGLLAFAVRPYPRGPLVVPVLWCLVGAQAAFLLGVYQDLGLIFAGVAGVVLLVRSKVPAPSFTVAS